MSFGFVPSDLLRNCASFIAFLSAVPSAKEDRLSEDEMEPRLCAIGHSLDSAVAIDFARRHRVQRVVAIAPFITLCEEAARVITGPLSYLLIENYDNPAGVVEIRQRNPEAKIAIFHGTKDEVIPVRMGRELAQNFSFSSTSFRLRARTM